MPKFKEIAQELIYGNWQETSAPDAKAFIKSASYEILSFFLLLDIAESLRILRCQNFKDIPYRLDQIRNRLEQIRLNTTKKRKKRAPAQRKRSS